MRTVLKKGFLALFIFSVIFSGIGFASQADAASTKANWWGVKIEAGKTKQLAAFEVPSGSEFSLRLDLESKSTPNVTFTIRNASKNYAQLASFKLLNNFGNDYGDAYTNRWTRLTQGTYVIEATNNGPVSVTSGGSVFLP